MPLHAIVMSGLPKRKYQKIKAVAEAATAARLVLTAITEMRRSDAPRVEPGLKPIQPNKRIKVPITTKARLCAGKGRGLPSGPYLPMRGPRIDGERHGAEAADGMDNGRAREVHVAVTQAHGGA